MHARFYCIETWSGYGLSVQDPQGVSHILPPESDSTALGVALTDAVAHSRIFTLEMAKATDIFGFPLISARYAAWVERLKQTAGLKTRKALFKELRFCEITERDGLLAIVPKHHVKREAWEQLASGPVELTVPAGAPPAEIGDMLKQAFALCT